MKKPELHERNAGYLKFATIIIAPAAPVCAHQLSSVNQYSGSAQVIQVKLLYYECYYNRTTLGS